MKNYKVKVVLDDVEVMNTKRSQSISWYKMI